MAQHFEGGGFIPCKRRPTRTRDRTLRTQVSPKEIIYMYIDHTNDDKGYCCYVKRHYL